MRFNKKLAFTLSSTLIALSAVLWVTISTIVPAAASNLVIDEETFFDVEHDGHTYHCYNLKIGDVPTTGIAIAWGENPENTPVNLTIPDKFGYGGGEYTIKAIAKHGFRYCDFETITLPQTVELIKEEAFAYCQNLKTFTIPHLVDEIAPSTFLDCRKLETIAYTNAEGTLVMGNSTITRLGDHAFDSCVSLKNFFCPKSLVYIGESCFQKCSELVTFFFPKTIKSGNVIQNNIEVCSYAFADCKMLRSIYYETNMKIVHNYAFVDCHSELKIKYTGSSKPDYYVNGVKQNYWRCRYLASNHNTKDFVDIEYNQSPVETDDNYPCLRYSIENKAVKLDLTYKESNCSIYAIDSAEASAESYISIYKFETPIESVAGCFDVDTGELTIPNEINGIKVKIIKSSAFANNDDIKSVKFNANLRQICNKAFYNCLNISSLDFSDCDNLREISYQVFQPGNDNADLLKNIKNTLLTSLTLPDNLEYIGCYAFANFTNVNSLHIPNNLKLLGDLAFYNLGNSIKNPNVDVVLPNTLEDDYAKNACPRFIANGSYGHSNDVAINSGRWYAIGKYAFLGANCVRTITMQIDTTHENDDTYTTSVYSNAFKDCTNLLRFKSNANLKYLGKDSFKGCSSLREVFLTSTKAESATEDYPWCINEENGSYGGTLFYGASPELVVYIDGASAPRELENYTLTTDPTGSDIRARLSKWNAETGDSYLNPISISDTYASQSRTVVPTYYNVDFENDIIYWDPKTKTINDTAPVNLDGYNNGVVSIVKTGTDANSNPEYTIARYYSLMSKSNNVGRATPIVDLTAIPGISTDSIHYLKGIGPEAFARSDNFDGTNNNIDKAPGAYFVIPESVTTIGERAFFRKTQLSKEAEKGNGRYGVRIVTYRKANGKILAADGTTELDYPSGLNSLIEEIDDVSDVTLKRGFCVLSPNVTHIGSNAFLNNIFESVYLGANVSFIGHGAFYVHQSSDDYKRTTITSLTIDGDNPYFESDADGIYYIGGTNAKKTLLSQCANISGTLSIADNTKAIGLQACANTSYTKITLPAGLTTIYGSGFAKNVALTEMEVTSSLRYIGAMEKINPNSTWDDDGYTEIWDNTTAPYFDNQDHAAMSYNIRAISESQYGAFAGCSRLTTLNFKNMTELRKIGWAAFKDCKSLKSMSGTTEYIYKKYSGSSKTYTTVTISGRSNTECALDLSGCTHLRSIAKEAFYGCSNLKFLHLPDTRGSATESQIYIGRDPDAPAYLTGTTEKNVSPNFIFNPIIEGNKGIYVLVGETAYYANGNYGGTPTKIYQHYPSTCFSTGNYIYYHVNSAADAIGPDSALRFWTTKTTSEGTFYVLFDKKSDVTTYYANL